MFLVVTCAHIKIKEEQKATKLFGNLDSSKQIMKKIKGKEQNTLFENSLAYTVC